MNDFKVGDRVEVVAAESAGGYYKNGDVFTIAKVDDDDGDLDMVEMTGMFLHSREVRHAPAIPDLITINRADLPEVRQEGDSVVIIRGKGCIYTANHNPETARASAADFIALAEFLEAREKAAEEAAAAEKDAAASLTKRRDELAEVVAKNAGWYVWAGTEYADHQCEAQAAIDMMIAAEADRG